MVTLLYTKGTLVFGMDSDDDSTNLPTTQEDLRNFSGSPDIPIPVWSMALSGSSGNKYWFDGHQWKVIGGGN